MKKRLKVVSVVGAIIIFTTSGIKVYDKSINHLDKVCPLNKVFGIEHQVKEIERLGYDATYCKEVTQKFYRKGDIITLRDGYYIEYYEIAPEGYEKLDEPHGIYDYYKEETFPERIEIYSNGTLVKKLILK